jgi:hypothetical protein
VRAGPVARAGDNADAFECGRWELRGEHGELLRVIELGEPVNDDALLEDPALTDDASEEALRRRIAEGATKEPGGAGTRLARLRLAGRTGRPWPGLDADGPRRRGHPAHPLIGDAGAVALAGSAALTALRSLDLSGNGLGDEGALALARSPHLAALEWLQLGRAEVSQETREALRARFGDRVKLESR